MPELPDIELYVAALRPRVVGEVLRKAVIRSPFLLRSVEPGVEVCEGRRIVSVERVGKRVVLGVEADGAGEVFLVLHLMIAGRLLWKGPAGRPSGRIDLAAFGFDGGTLVLTEAGTKRRASLHVVRGREGLVMHDPGGIDPLSATPAEFAAALTRENRTLKRALTSPRVLSGIGNAYSDEILHAAGLSPLKLTRSLSEEEVARLHKAAAGTLRAWSAKLRKEFGVTAKNPGRFPGPGDITAFRPDFAVHGRFGEPCPACGALVQRIVYAENETNYCPGCQTGGKVLADRALSRLLKDDWPRTVEEWEGA